jgi:acetyl-CoA acyltransferase
MGRNEGASILGVGMTPFGRHGKNLRELAHAATLEALADADITAAQVGAVFFANGAAGLITGQEMMRGQSALRYTGLLGAPITNVENACASGSTAFHLAVQSVTSGACDVALAVGAEVLSHPDKQRSFAAIGAAVDLLTPPPFVTDGAGGADEAKHSPFMELYARRARAYMERSGATIEDFARVTVKSRRFAAGHDRAQYRTPVDVATVLEARAVVDPLTVLMCSPIGDGAAAVVVASPGFVRSRRGRHVTVRASALVSGRDRSDDEPTATERAAALAYERAGVSPTDVDVAEVHDGAGPAELMAYEALGFCGPGQGVELLRSGATDAGGVLPVNTGGGLLSRGHPIGATGCAQIVELFDQLTGRAGGRQVAGASVGLAHNGGGSLGADSAAMTVTILARS